MKHEQPQPEPEPEPEPSLVADGSSALAEVIFAEHLWFLHFRKPGSEVLAVGEDVAADGQAWPSVLPALIALGSSNSCHLAYPSEVVQCTAGPA